MSPMSPAEYFVHLHDRVVDDAKSMIANATRFRVEAADIVARAEALEADAAILNNVASRMRL